MFDATTLNVTPAVQLTPRRKEALLLVIAGLTDRQIAERMGISHSGVRKLREKMLLQNGCAAMFELIAKYQAQLAAEQSATREGVVEEGALWDRKNTP